jgi:hypothetical protein
MVELGTLLNVMPFEMNPHCFMVHNCVWTSLHLNIPSPAVQIAHEHNVYVSTGGWMEYVLSTKVSVSVRAIVWQRFLNTWLLALLVTLI